MPFYHVIIFFAYIMQKCFVIYIKNNHKTFLHSDLFAQIFFSNKDLLLDVFIWFLVFQIKTCQIKTHSNVVFIWFSSLFDFLHTKYLCIFENFIEFELKNIHKYLIWYHNKQYSIKSRSHTSNLIFDQTDIQISHIIPQWEYVYHSRTTNVRSSIFWSFFRSLFEKAFCANKDLFSK